MSPRARKTVAAVVAAAGSAAAYDAASPRPAAVFEGRAPRAQPSVRPAVTAAFARESYRPGSSARLVIRGPATNVRFEVLRAGPERSWIGPRDLMLGSAVTPPRRIGTVRTTRVAVVRISAWPSGLYFARLRAAGGKVGFAPFVVRPRALGASRIAVVLPTQTWQAYNFRDDDGDGDEDSWYAGGASVRMARPFENRGVPTNYRRYDQPFLRWLFETGKSVDYLAQSDLNTGSSGKRLAQLYDLIVFPGHHEYVTEQEYDAIESYRDAGGNLMFLTANNFFWKVERRGNVMRRIALWRELGRPESSLVGVQYFANDRGGHRAPWVVRDPHGAAGLFAAVGLQAGDGFGEGGIEVDRTTAHSPRNVRVLAELRWRRGRRAQMTYYETAAGAKVFAAGAFSIVTNLDGSHGRGFLSELWKRLEQP